MSYDLYCYKSQLGRPDLEEAQATIELDLDNPVDADPETKEKIAAALLNHNPRLERFEFDFEEIGRLQDISIEEAREKFNHIELTTPQGDLATQITIFDDNISITVPYWYSGEKAKEVFQQVMEYLKIIRRTAGYFVYDPQTENVYDPSTQDFDGLSLYQSMTGHVEQLRNDRTTKVHKKPWWKLW